MEVNEKLGQLLMRLSPRCRGELPPGAVVTGFFFVPTSAVLRTIVSTSNVVARKESVAGMSKLTRGQFPNNPVGWSNLEAEGRTVANP